MSPEGAVRYVAGLIERYQANLRGARRREHDRAIAWLETCVPRLSRELALMQGESPEGRDLARRWAFLLEGL